MFEVSKFNSYTLMSPKGMLPAWFREASSRVEHSETVSMISVERFRIFLMKPFLRMLTALSEFFPKIPKI